MRPRWKRGIFIAPFALLGVALFTFLGGEIVKYLWNWLTPTLFGLPQVTFWQALGLLVLCRILFGGMGGRGSGRTRSRFRERIAERWDRMTPEERERARESWRGRWGYCRAEGERGEKHESRG
ncbi:MAG: hypothetical protein ABJC13_21860 [Acidobacteriota bacterium]